VNGGVTDPAPAAPEDDVPAAAEPGRGHLARLGFSDPSTAARRIAASSHARLADELLPALASAADADAALLGLLDEIDGYLPDDDGSRPPAGPAALAAFELYTRAGPVRLFTVIATLGAPLEVTTAGLAIETFLPADSESAARLRQLNEPAAAATAADTSPLGLG
jgi:MmyB-like transcription regulator ligand binding domain